MVQEHHLGELLLDFFDLYGNKFNMTTTAIRMKPPGYIVKFVEVCRYF
jgi:non-canonical poly(A) RNA polymerase PAPD5/7